MKINNINKNLFKRALALVAVPVMLGSLTSCKKKENPNTTTEVVVEETRTVETVTTVPTKEPQTTTSTSKTTTSKTTTSATTTTNVETTTAAKKEWKYNYRFISEEEFKNISESNLTEKNNGEIFELIGKNHSIDEAKEVADIIISKARFEDRFGSYRTNDVKIAEVSEICLYTWLYDSVCEELSKSNVDKIDELNLNDELKEKYIYMNNLYTAYKSAVECKDAYLMIINGAKIYDSIRDLDELLLKNKITADERLNYFISYENNEIKESNLSLGESCLKTYFEDMRQFVEKDNNLEFYNWTSSDYAINNMFELLEEEFAVDKIDDKYVAIKINTNTKTR